MRRAPRGCWWLGIALTLALRALAADNPDSPDDRDAQVILPGQEQVIARMLGAGDSPVLGSCVWHNADIDRTYVKAYYDCGADRYLILLKFPAAAPPGAERTRSFAVVADPAHPAPPALLKAVAAHIRTVETTWHGWSEVASKDTNLAIVLPTPPTDAELHAAGPDALTPAQLKALDAARAKEIENPAAATDALIQLAAQNPSHGVLQLLAGTLTSEQPAKPRGEALAKAADAHPKDAAAQFAAGVVMQLLASANADDAGLRAKFGQASVKYLEATLPALEPYATLHAYLAVSQIRAGHVADANTQIARAVALAPEAPDVYYARAEVRQNHPKEAIADLQKYSKLVTERPGVESADKVATAADEMLKLQGQPPAETPTGDGLTNFAILLPTPPAEAELTSGPHALTPAQVASLATIRAKQIEDPAHATDALIALARENPNQGVIRLLAGAVTLEQVSRARGDELAKAADAHPDDPARQFAAGVAFQLLAHENGDDASMRGTYGQASVKYFSAALPAYEAVATLHVYRAVSEVRIGRVNDQFAQADIKRAATLAPELPDVYYARAEINQKHVTDAVADLEKFVSLLKARPDLAESDMAGTAQDEINRLKGAPPDETASPSSGNINFSIMQPMPPIDRDLHATDSHALTPAQLAALTAAKAKQAEDPARTTDALIELAKQNPYHGVLQLLAASLTTEEMTPARGEALTKSADAHRDDPARQFAAGVAMQLLGQKNADDTAQRATYGKACIKYLSASLPAFEPIATVHVYRAVCEVRMGRVDEAWAAADITRAFALAPDLPDAYYARAEVRQKRPAEAIADLQQYVKMLATQPEWAASDMAVEAQNQITRLQGTPLDIWHTTSGIVNFPVLLPAPPSEKELHTADAHALTPAQLSAIAAARAKLPDAPAAATDALLDVARQNPYHGVLQLLAASISAEDLTAARGNALASAADAHPDDPAAQFAAGVANQLLAQKNAEDSTLRAAFGKACLRYLSASLPAYNALATVHVYRSVCAVRMGRLADATADVARAVALAPTLPDVYYARAEVRQRRPKEAVADLKQLEKLLADQPETQATADMMETAEDQIARLEGRRHEHKPSTTPEVDKRYRQKLLGGLLLAALVGFGLWRYVVPRLRRPRAT